MTYIVIPITIGIFEFDSYVISYIVNLDAIGHLIAVDTLLLIQFTLILIELVSKVMQCQLLGGSLFVHPILIPVGMTKEENFAHFLTSDIGYDKRHTISIDHLGINIEEWNSLWYGWLLYRCLWSRLTAIFDLFQFLPFGIFCIKDSPVSIFLLILRTVFGINSFFKILQRATYSSNWRKILTFGTKGVVGIIFDIIIIEKIHNELSDTVCGHWLSLFDSFCPRNVDFFSFLLLGLFFFLLLTLCISTESTE